MSGFETTLIGRRPVRSQAMATALRAFRAVKPAHLMLAPTIGLMPRPKTTTPDLAHDGSHLHPVQLADQAC
jgi:hypothetical protein